MRHHEEDGFTVVELMTVVLIIAILAGIAVASFVSSSSMSERVACRSNQRVLAEGVLQYGIENDYADPDDISDLAPYVRSYGKCSRCPADGRLLVFDASSGSVTCTYPGH